MWKPVLAGFAIWTVVVGCCFVFNETPTRASHELTGAQEPPPAPSPASRDAPSQLAIQPEPSAAQQMQTLDHHARVRMICYPGRFGPSDAPAIALDVRVKLK